MSIWSHNIQEVSIFDNFIHGATATWCTGLATTSRCCTPPPARLRIYCIVRPITPSSPNYGQKDFLPGSPKRPILTSTSPISSKSDDARVGKPPKGSKSRLHLPWPTRLRRHRPLLHSWSFPGDSEPSSLAGFAPGAPFSDLAGCSRFIN